VRNGLETQAERTEFDPSPSSPSLRPESRREASKGTSLSNADAVTSGTVASAISSATVRMVREYTGRGPTKARTYITEDLISIVLQDTLTMGEKSLVRDGHADLVLSTRKAFQETMGPHMIAVVEEISGRAVLAFLSDNHIDPDVAIESFLLAPKHAGEPDTERANAEAPD
jgi:uncharacterized protein YbcI